MSKFNKVFSIYLAIGFVLLGFIIPSNAQTYGNQADTRDVLRDLKQQTGDFYYALSNELKRSSINANDKRNLADASLALNGNIKDFESKFNQRREDANDVRDILTEAKKVNDIFGYNQVNSNLNRNWLTIRNLLDQLGANYNVSPVWNDRNSGYSSSRNDNNYPRNNRNDNNYPQDNRFPDNNRNQRNNRYPNDTRNGRNDSSNDLTGTYSLDVSRSENARDIANRAVINNSRNRNEAKRDLENKLESPEQIAVDVRGNQITLDTSRASQITFAANGREQTQTLSDGRTLRVRATLVNDLLTISSLGGDTDYTVTFEAINDGRNMRVTRRVTTDYLRQTVFAESVYTKTDSVARLSNDVNYNDNNDDYSSSSSNDYPRGNRRNNPNDNRNYPNNNRGNYPSTNSGRRGQFIVPDGAIISGTLDSDVDTKVSQNNDRFRMTVQSPNQFRGAVVEGYLSGIDRSGKVSGRSEVTFNFQSIRLSNGQSYDFAGTLKGITDLNGDDVKIDNEGAAKGDNQTSETIKRSGIGAGIGAIIGAIAGGGKGAAIGAVIGGGAGAGSVILQGKDDLKLEAGSTLTVESSSPIR